MDSRELSDEDLQEILAVLKASETSDESDDWLDLINDEKEGISLCPCGNNDKFSLQRDDTWTCRECGRALKVGFNKDKIKRTIDQKDIDKKCDTKYPFCPCGNSNENEVEEVVTAKETIWKCKVCGKGIGEQDCKRLSKVLSFDNSPLDSINRNDTIVKVKLGGNTCNAVKLRNKDHKDEPNGDMSTEGFCPCGNTDIQQIEEQHINGETYWKCKKCGKGIGDRESKRLSNLHTLSPQNDPALTTKAHLEPSVRSGDTSASLFYNIFCSCQYSEGSSFPETINGEVQLKCKKCSGSIMSQDNLSNHDDETESEIPQNTILPDETTAYNKCQTIGQQFCSYSNTDLIDFEEETVGAFWEYGKCKTGKNNDLQRSHNEQNITSDIDEIFDDKDQDEPNRDMSTQGFCPCGNAEVHKIEELHRNGETYWRCKKCEKGIGDRQSKWLSNTINSPTTITHSASIIRNKEKLEEQAMVTSSIFSPSLFYNTLCSYDYSVDDALQGVTDGQTTLKCKKPDSIQSNKEQNKRCADNLEAYAFCPCGNTNDNEVEEVVTAKETIWKCKVCGKGIGEQECKRLSKVLSFDNSPLYSINRNDTIVKVKLGGNTCNAVKLRNKDHKGEPNGDMSTEGFCPCGNTDIQQIEEQHINGETYWKCKKCGKGIGDRESKRLSNLHTLSPQNDPALTTKAHSEPNIRSGDISASLFYNIFCSCQYSEGSSFPETINGEVQLKCKKCSGSIMSQDNLSNHDDETESEIPQNTILPDETTAYNKCQTIGQQFCSHSNTDLIDFEVETVGAFWEYGKCKTGKNNDLQRSHNEQNITSDIDEIFDDKDQDEPNRDMSTQGFCPCGNAEVHKIEELHRNGETYWRCKKCEKGIGDRQSKWLSNTINSPTTITHSASIIRNKEKLEEQAMVTSSIFSPSLFYNTLCSYDYSVDDALQGVTDGQTTLKCKKPDSIQSNKEQNKRCADNLEAYAFCPCGNTNDNEVEEVVTAKETIWKCKVCGKGIGEQECKRLSKVLSFDNSPLYSINRNDTIVKVKLGGNTCNAVKLQNKDHKDEPNRDMSTEGFCPCGNTDIQQIEEQHINGETYWKCKCGKGIGDRESKRLSNLHTLSSQNDPIMDIKHSAIIMSQDSLSNHTEETESEIPQNKSLPDETTFTGNTDIIDFEEENVRKDTFWQCRKRKTVKNNDMQRSNSEMSLTSDIEDCFDDNDHKYGSNRDISTKGSFSKQVSHFSFLRHCVLDEKSKQFCTCSVSTPDLLNPTNYKARSKCKKCKGPHLHDDFPTDDDPNEVHSNSLGSNCNISDIPKGAKPAKFEKTTLENLIEGDHIKWKEHILDLVHREGIIKSIDYTKSLLHVVWNKPKPLPYAQIEETGLICTNKVTLSKAVYNCSVLPADLVIVRALSRRGEKKYNPVNNNTTQFPVWCKTNNGSKVPLQSVPIKDSKQACTKKIQEFREFTVGNHIKFTRGPIYDHHAIVYAVHGKSQEITVAHYSTKEWPDGILKKVSKIFQKGKLAEVMLERLQWDHELKCLIPFMESNYVQTDLKYSGKQNGQSRIQLQSKLVIRSGNRVSRYVQTDFSHNCRIQKGETWRLNPLDNTFAEFLEKSQQKPSKTGYKKKKKTLPTTRESVHKVLYSGPIYPPENISERVRVRLGETSYSLMTNNCEHFASWCCTGSGKSTQVEAFLKKHILTLGSVSLIATVESLQLLLCGLPSLPTGILSAVSIADKFLIVAEGLLPISLIGPVFQCVIMIIIKGIKIHKIMGQFKKGHITKHDRNLSIAAEIAEGVISSGLALLLGIVLGYLVPIPVLGNVIGAVLGSLIGYGIGKILKHYLFKKGSNYHMV